LSTASWKVVIVERIQRDHIARVMGIVPSTHVRRKRLGQKLIADRLDAGRRAALALERVRNPNFRCELNGQETPAIEIRELKKEASRGRLHFE
jgi:hypothetical protein